jgi:hypothetical protein
MTLIERLPDDFDECECGDYRRDHVDGVGRCKMPNDLNHGFRPCDKFRLALRARSADNG